MYRIPSIVSSALYACMHLHCREHMRSADHAMSGILKIRKMLVKQVHRFFIRILFIRITRLKIVKKLTYQPNILENSKLFRQEKLETISFPKAEKEDIFKSIKLLKLEKI